MNNQVQAQQDFDKLFKKELENARFPIDQIKLSVHKYALAMLHTKSLATAGCDLVTYEKLSVDFNRCNDVKEFDLYSISYLINGIPATSPKDLGMLIEPYIALVKDANEMAGVWNELVAPIRKKLSDKLKTQAMLQAPSKNMKVIPSGRR